MSARAVARAMLGAARRTSKFRLLTRRAIAAVLAAWRRSRASAYCSSSAWWRRARSSTCAPTRGRRVTAAVIRRRAGRTRRSAYPGRRAPGPSPSSARRPERRRPPDHPRHAAPGHRDLPPFPLGPHGRPDAPRLAAPRPPRRRRPRAAARRLHLDLLGRRRRRRPGEPRVLPGRVQHRGARARPPLPPLLAARLRAGAREPRRRARPRARRRRGRRTVAALTLTVGAGAARLDAFLHGALPALSRRFVRRLIAEGAVCVNGRPAAKGVRVAPGDRVTLPDLPASIAPEPQLALPVLHEDDAVVALDKPGGMPGHALDPRQRGTAAAFLLAPYPELAGA